MAIAPRFFGTVAEHINSEGLKTDGYNRLVIEKPFGRSYESALELNNSLTKTFSESEIYRMDHYLGKFMVQQLTHIRLKNKNFEKSLNSQYVSNIQVTLSESLGVEDRGGYYETAGVLRDMIQNHIMQIIGAVAMDEPAKLDSESIHEVKRDVFDSLKDLKPEEVDRNFVRGQYDEDITGKMKAYRDEDNVDPKSNIETFVGGKILLDNERWNNVPFYVRSGKRMPAKSSRIDIVYNDNVSELGINPNTTVTFLIEPEDGSSILVNGIDYQESNQTLIKFPEQPDYFDNEREAYESLMIDILDGNKIHFTLWDELENAWKYVDVIRQQWDNESPIFPNYMSNTIGPDAASELLEKDGNSWVWDD
jgi:glucose-6-phosphate 1-dehydrogenase